jgi:hypothetical protein
VLVRPDAHVAWRADAAVEDATAELSRAMERLLGVVEPVPESEEEHAWQ